MSIQLTGRTTPKTVAGRKFGEEPSGRRPTHETLAIRLEDEQHARLTILAKLSGVSLTDTIREALEGRIAALASDPEIAAKAESLTAEIDREAAEQRDANARIPGFLAVERPRGQMTWERKNHGPLEDRGSNISYW